MVPSFGYDWEPGSGADRRPLLAEGSLKLRDSGMTTPLIDVSRGWSFPPDSHGRRDDPLSFDGEEDLWHLPHSTPRRDSFQLWLFSEGGRLIEPTPSRIV